MRGQGLHNPIVRLPMNSFFLKLQKVQYYILVPLVLLLSFALAYAIRTGIVFQLPKPSAEKIFRTISVSANTITPKAVSAYEDTVTGNLIRGSLPSAEPQGADGDGQPVPVLTEEVPGSDDSLVTGTLSGSPKFARVTIKPKEKDEGDEFAIGEKFAGYLIKGIYNHYIVLFKNGTHFKVEIGETIAEGKKRVLKTDSNAEGPAVASNVPPGGCPVTKKMLSRTQFELMLKDEGAIYKDARFGPNLVDGKVDGYKLSQVPSNHIFYALGARNGDIVKRVNGFPLSDTKKMMELWSNIKDSSKVSIDLDRKGKCMTYEFTIRN